MNDKRSPHFYLAIFWLLISIVTLCSGATPQRPYYSETPNPRHIANNDRLTAEYFNNQLNVIYNWAQRTHTELDNLLHNGIGVASLTVGILNCTNKIINPEWDNLLHNGVGVASITVGLVKTNDLEISNKIDVPAIEFSGRSQPTPPVNNGMLYFDSDLQRFRVFQENGWRDLSSNYIIDGTTLTNPLIIDGYLDTRYVYVNNNASISKNLFVGENINSSGTATIQNVNILNDSTINRNLTVKGNINSSGTANIKNLNVTDNSTINKNLTVKGKLNASGPAILESLKVNKTLKVPVTASTTLGVGSVYYDTTAGKLKVLNSSNSWDTVGNDIAVDTSMSSSSTNPVQNKVIYSALTQLATSLTNTLTNYVDTTKNNILESVLLGYVSAVTQGQTNGTIRVTKNGSATDVSVKGLGSAAYANVASFSAPITSNTDLYVKNLHIDNKLYVDGNYSIFDYDLLVGGNIKASETVRADSFIGRDVYASESMRLPRFDSVPVSGTIGSIGYNNTDQKLYYRAASGWTSLDSGGSGVSNIRLKATETNQTMLFPKTINNQYNGLPVYNTSYVVDLSPNVCLWIIPELRNLNTDNNNTSTKLQKYQAWFPDSLQKNWNKNWDDITTNMIILTPKICTPYDAYGDKTFPQVKTYFGDSLCSPIENSRPKLLTWDFGSGGLNGEVMIPTTVVLVFSGLGSAEDIMFSF